MPKIDNSAARVQEILKNGGTVDQITKKIANILNGSIVVKKAEQDANGSNIVDTYATKDEFNDRSIQIVNLDSNGSTFIEEYEALNDIVVSGIYKINITGSDNLIGWLIVAPHNNALFQILIDYMSTIRYRTKDAPTLNWNNWESFATYQQLQDKESDIMYQVTNNLTAIVETITLTTTNIGSLTVSSELNNLRDNKIYKIKCGYKYGWLFVTQRELEMKNTIQTIIDFDGSIYHRYHSGGSSEEGWSDWILTPDDEYIQELLVQSFDERGIRQPDPIPSYDELTEHGIYSLDKGLIDNEYVFSVHSPVSSAEITQYRLNSEEGLLKRTYSQNMETGEYSWSDWSKYITKDVSDNTYLSKTDASTTYATKEELLNNIETVSIASITNHSFTNSTELDSLNYSKIYKLEHGSYVGWLFVSRSDTNPPVTQILIDIDGTIFHRYYRETSGFAWSEWSQDYKDYTDSLERALENGLITVGKAKADINGNPIDTTYATKTELRPTPITSTATAITANNSYNYGEQTELSIAFPTTANDGDVVYITFTSGATATVLTLDTTNTSDIELIPEANTGYEVYAKYNGTIWIVNYSDYTVTAEAGA